MDPMTNPSTRNSNLPENIANPKNRMPPPNQHGILILLFTALFYHSSSPKFSPRLFVRSTFSHSAECENVYVGNSYANGSSIEKVEPLSLPSESPGLTRSFASGLCPDASAFVGLDKLAGDLEAEAGAENVGL